MRSEELTQSETLGVRFPLRRVDVRVDRRRPYLPMEQSPGDNLRSAQHTAVPCRQSFPAPQTVIFPFFREKLFKIFVHVLIINIHLCIIIS